MALRTVPTTSTPPGPEPGIGALAGALIEHIGADDAEFVAQALVQQAHTVRGETLGLAVLAILNTPRVA